MNGPEPGLEILPGLILLRRLGKGGMGEAWLARDAERGCEVVAKLVPASAAPEAVALLRREARLVRKLDHPRIVPVYGFRGGPNGSVVTQRYMPGGDAGRRRGADLALIVALGRDVADALAYLHQLGVVHRDVKLSNVLLDEQGRAHLADFGIASLGPGEEDGLVLRGGGSRASMSPEQRAGAPPQPTDDLYALGVLLHELIAGEAPTTATLPPLPPTVPVRLRGLVNALVAVSPSERPRSAAAVRGELDAVAAELAHSSAAADRVAVRLQPPPRAAETVLAPSGYGREPRAQLTRADRALEPWQLALVLGLGLLAVVSVIWLPRWASAPAVVASPASTPAAPSPPPTAEAPAVNPAPREAEAPAATPELPPSRHPASDPPRRTAAIAPDPTAAPASTPAPAPTPDRLAEAAALAAHRDAGLALESREDWNGALREYEAALAIDSHVTFGVDGRERTQKRAALDEALAFHSQRPERLSAPAVAREVETLLERARGVQPPPGPALQQRIEALEAVLARARTPVAVVIESDGLTELTLSRVGRLGTLTRRSLELVPGTYTLTGSRRGYRDVRRQFSVTPGAALPAVTLRCQEAL